jgi:hypothetical protein
MEPEDRIRARGKKHSRRTSGAFSDLLNVVIFLVMLTVIIAILMVLDPTVKHWFTRYLP